MWWIVGAVLEWPPLLFCLRGVVWTSKWAVWFPIMVVRHGIRDARWAALSSPRGRVPRQHRPVQPIAMNTQEVSPQP